MTLTPRPGFMSSHLDRSPLRALRDALTGLVEQVAPSVVTVRITDVSEVGGSGSGWIFSPGYVVTNAHVVRGTAPGFRLRLRGGALVPAQLIGCDRLTDLAVLRADIDLTPLPLRATPVPLAELCFAFGSPLGDFPETATLGVVSGLDRRLPLSDGFSIENVLQTDAEINPGNSGGPLVDVEGAVIGVNTAIRTDGRGVGFAIPASTVESIVPELIECGQVQRPKLGVAIDVVEHHGRGESHERLRVASASADNPLRAGDILLAIEQRPLVSRGDLFQVLRRPLIGRSTNVLVEREGREVTIELRLS